MNKKKILVTGAAGFVGFHLVSALLKRGDTVVGLDNINDYYDTTLKLNRLSKLGILRNNLFIGKKIQSSTYPDYCFVRGSIEDKELLFDLFDKEQFDIVVNLAAQAGVRHSITNPDVYIASNLVGFFNILEACRHYPVRHLVYASSSSVYGNNKVIPFATDHKVDDPVSLYAATKKSNELMAHTYSHLYKIPTTGLRFFTVYGPWGRPDMAYFLFVDAILKGKPIKVFNFGDMKRDFTYIDDIVEGVVRVVDRPVASRQEEAASDAPYRIYNIGNSTPVKLLDFISAIERSLGREAVKEYLPIQPGDVPATWADVEALERDFGYRPQTSIENGVKKFIDWYREYYGV